MQRRTPGRNDGLYFAGTLQLLNLDLGLALMPTPDHTFTFTPPQTSSRRLELQVFPVSTSKVTQEWKLFSEYELTSAFSYDNTDVSALETLLLYAFHLDQLIRSKCTQPERTSGLDSQA
jgi:hypothetical protein